MSVQQISVFVESKPGHLSRVIDAFTQANVSVRGYSASDTGDYGIVRFVVDDPDRALQVLHDMNCARKPLCCAFALRTSLASWRVF